MSYGHGTPASYARGCRCDGCRLAASRRTMQWREDVRHRPVPDHLHGKVSTYTNRSCRCELCADAMRAYRRRRRWDVDDDRTAPPASSTSVWLTVDIDAIAWGDEP